MQGETVFSRSFILPAMAGGLFIGVLLQFMLMRIETVGFDWVATLLQLAAFGILVMVGLVCHYELYHVQQ